MHQDPEDEKGGHWVTASNINSDSSVDFDVYDSQKSVDDNDDYDNEDLYFLSKVIRCNNNVLRVGFPVVQQQDENSSDCGLFALLNAFILGNNIDKPERVEVNDVRRLRRDVHAFLTTQNTLHLRQSYVRVKKPPSRKAPPPLRIKIYCICRSADIDTMTQCKKC